MISIFKKKKLKSSSNNNIFEEPTALGIRTEIPLFRVIQIIDGEYTKFYGDNFKSHFTSNRDWSDLKFRITLFELKRYFAISSVLKKSPMRSNTALTLFQEMLNYSSDFPQFSTLFSGRNLSEESKTQIDDHDQAMFEWFYFSFFEPTEFTSDVWESFHQTRFSQDQLFKYKQMSNTTLLCTVSSMQGLNHLDAIWETANLMISKLRFHLHSSNRTGELSTGLDSGKGDIFPILHRPLPLAKNTEEQ